MKDQYVILTGSKNNAGDYLIKYRAKQLFASNRPDREIVDLDGWKPLTEEQIDTINQSKALILTGGPALQNGMRQRIYPLTDDLTKIRVPILMMGVGYKGRTGSWAETANYPIDPDSKALLDRIEQSGYLSGVRDYHTLNTLMHHGRNQFMMTGCPALYDLAYLNKPFQYPEQLGTIGFSLGVSYIQSARMFGMMQRIIESLRNGFAQARLTVYFHHKIDRNVTQQERMTAWLDRQQIAYVDISGSEQNLIEAYSNVAVHIGYRVHAHIFMSSISKPSILISEDGRGVALKEVIGGISPVAFKSLRTGKFYRGLARLGLADNFRVYPSLARDIVQQLAYEQQHHYPRMSETRTAIDHHYPLMQQYLQQLP